MLHISIVINELQSSFTGQIMLYLNTGGVRKAVMEEERFLKVEKVESAKPVNQILVGQQRST
jgi:hypothetical protein